MSAQESCWRFIGRVYAAPGVQDTCLMLQQQCDADIVLLLFAGWLASKGTRLSPDDVAEVAALVQPWREQAVLSLRRIRTDLKKSPAMKRSSVAALYDRIKADELAAERIELDMLVDWGQARALPNLAPTEELVADNLVASLQASTTLAGYSAASSLPLLVAACVQLIRATPRGG